MPGKMFQKAVMGNVFSLLWALLKGEPAVLFSSYVQMPESFIRSRQDDNSNNLILSSFLLFLLTFCVLTLALTYIMVYVFTDNF